MNIDRSRTEQAACQESKGKRDEGDDTLHGLISISTG
jgi:hypothetical protein